MSIAIIWAFLKRDAREALSYRAAFVMRFFSWAVSLGALFYLARFVDTAHSPMMGRYGGGYFSFGLVGMVLFNIQYVAITAYPNTIRQAQLTGTLETMMTTPTPSWVVLVCSPLYRVTSAYVMALAVLLGSAVVIGTNINPASLPLLLVAAILGPVAFASFGFISATLTMLFRRSDMLTPLIGAASTLAGGVMFPTAVLPAWLKSSGDFLPITPALEIVRLSLFGGASPEMLLEPLGKLALICCVLLPCGLFSFTWAMRRARKDGSLSHY